MPALAKRRFDFLPAFAEKGVICNLHVLNTRNISTQYITTDHKIDLCNLLAKIQQTLRFGISIAACLFIYVKMSISHRITTHLEANPT